MEKAITLDSVNKSLGGREILKNVCFEVDEGDIFGFLGPNGAGKTTTIRIALGILKPSSGRSLIFGKDVNQDETRKNIGFVLEMDGLYDNLSAYDNLNYYCRIYSVANPHQAITKNLKLVDLSSRVNDKVGTFSKGMRQRLALARAMLHDPWVLILDEPSTGVDPIGQIEMRQLILDKARDEGKTFFLSSHNLDEVQRICNRIALINRGEIKLYGDKDKLRNEANKGYLVIDTMETIPEVVTAELKCMPGVRIESKEEGKLTLATSDGNGASDIIGFLMARGVKIEQVKHRETSLEEIYTNILKEVER